MRYVELVAGDTSAIVQSRTFSQGHMVDIILLSAPHSGLQSQLLIEGSLSAPTFFVVLRCHVTKCQDSDSGRCEKSIWLYFLPGSNGFQSFTGPYDFHDSKPTDSEGVPDPVGLYHIIHALVI